MSRMNQKDMVIPREAQTAKSSPSGASHVNQGPKVFTMPKGGEVHLRQVAGGVLGTIRDSNYNTIQEVFAPDSSSLTIGG